MRVQLILKGAATAAMVGCLAAATVAQRASVVRPGYTGGGVTLLLNGWRISPAGRHFAIGDLPLAMTLSPDGHALVVTNNGYAKPTLRVVDLDRQQIASTFSLDDAWLGMAWDPDGAHLYSSGAAANSIVELSWQNDRFR